MGKEILNFDPAIIMKHIICFHILLVYLGYASLLDSIKFFLIKKKYEAHNALVSMKLPSVTKDIYLNINRLYLSKKLISSTFKQSN